MSELPTTLITQQAKADHLYHTFVVMNAYRLYISISILMSPPGLESLDTVSDVHLDQVLQPSGAYSIKKIEPQTPESPHPRKFQPLFTPPPISISFDRQHNVTDLFSPCQARRIRSLSELSSNSSPSPPPQEPLPVVAVFKPLTLSPQRVAFLWTLRFSADAQSRAFKFVCSMTKNLVSLLFSSTMSVYSVKYKVISYYVRGSESEEVGVHGVTRIAAGAKLYRPLYPILSLNERP